MDKSSEITDVHGAIAFLRTYNGLESDAQLARWLGISPQALPNWKAKGEVPRYVNLLIAEIRKSHRARENVQAVQYDVYMKDETPRRFNRSTGVLEEYDEEANRWREI